MQTDCGRELVGLIEVERLHHFPDIGTQFFPSIAFGHNAVTQALRAKAAVGFLDHFKDKITHGSDLSRRRGSPQARYLSAS